MLLCAYRQRRGGGGGYKTADGGYCSGDVSGRTNQRLTSSVNYLSLSLSLPVAQTMAFRNLTKYRMLLFSAHWMVRDRTSPTATLSACAPHAPTDVVPRQLERDRIFLSQKYMNMLFSIFLFLLCVLSLSVCVCVSLVSAPLLILALAASFPLDVSQRRAHPDYFANEASRAAGSGLYYYYERGRGRTQKTAFRR